MSDEDISGMLSSKTFLCPCRSKFGEIDTMENTEEEEKTAVSSGYENEFCNALDILFFPFFIIDGPLKHTTK